MRNIVENTKIGSRIPERGGLPEMRRKESGNASGVENRECMLRIADNTIS